MPQLIADDRDTEAVVDLLIERKGTATAATAWEGYLAAGRGYLMTDGRSAAYIPRAEIKHQFPASSADRQRLLRAVDSYDPCTEVVLIVSWADGSWTIRRYAPPIAPEAALLAWAGTPGMAPMQTSICACHPTGVASVSIRQGCPANDGQAERDQHNALSDAPVAAMSVHDQVSDRVNFPNGVLPYDLCD
jgi:hypothetical protein